MRIEILSFEGCPNVETAHDNVQRALELELVSAEVKDVVIENIDEVQQLQFIGSPSIRVDGIDVEDGAGQRTDYGFMCRTYVTKTGVAGSPSVEVIRAAIRSAK